MQWAIASKMEKFARGCRGTTSSGPSSCAEVRDFFETLSKEEEVQKVPMMSKACYQLLEEVYDYGMEQVLRLAPTSIMKGIYLGPHPKGSQCRISHYLEPKLSSKIHKGYTMTDLLYGALEAIGAKGTVGPPPRGPLQRMAQIISNAQWQRKGGNKSRSTDCF
eukprot:TRINITY_DN58889_c0_g1_i1.p1 TRINITY_DN58889_c0_g1~~TRINITY_DN58889_c0_g1_i1.p1  ORF type:complete len:163 (+),score=20.75 TRINITY_DN58889_c0_g1_i1:121-609(+)